MQKSNKKVSRSTRVRASIKTSGRPRLSIYRSNAHLWAQIIDDAKGETKIVRATAVGTEIAKLALAKKITKIVFDRGSYKFHGRVKAVAEAARLGGLQF